MIPINVNFIVIIRISTSIFYGRNGDNMFQIQHAHKRICLLISTELINNRGFDSSVRKRLTTTKRRQQLLKSSHGENMGKGIDLQCTTRPWNCLKKIIWNLEGAIFPTQFLCYFRLYSSSHIGGWRFKLPNMNLRCTNSAKYMFTFTSDLT